MRFLLTLVAIGALSTSLFAQSSICSPATDTQTTEWGHMHMVLDFQEKPFKALDGMIKNPLMEPIPGTLVEIYTYREHDPLPTQSDSKTKYGQRLAACVTGKDGKFRFDLPAGRYEVRASKEDRNSTSALVVVDPRKGKSRRDLQIVLVPGT